MNAAIVSVCSKPGDAEETILKSDRLSPLCQKQATYDSTKKDK